MNTSKQHTITRYTLCLELNHLTTDRAALSAAHEIALTLPDYHGGLSRDAVGMACEKHTVALGRNVQHAEGNIRRGIENIQYG
jgi:hypothetical protein